MLNVNGADDGDDDDGGGWGPSCSSLEDLEEGLFNYCILLAISCHAKIDLLLILLICYSDLFRPIFCSLYMCIY